MSSVTVYHYTTIPRAGIIIGKRKEFGNKPGLEPRIGIGTFTEDGIPVKATFALLEPIPENWTHNLLFPGVWNFLTERLYAAGEGSVLLEIDRAQDYNAFVANRDIWKGFSAHTYTKQISHHTIDIQVKKKQEQLLFHQ